MATGSCAFSKKGCLLARDMFGLNRANTIANDRFQQNKSPVGALSDLQPLQYANKVRLAWTAYLFQNLTLLRNQRINPQTRRAAKAV
jgi:hypothetical protein